MLDYCIFDGVSLFDRTVFLWLCVSDGKMFCLSIHACLFLYERHPLLKSPFSSINTVVSRKLMLLREYS